MVRSWRGDRAVAGAALENVDHATELRSRLALLDLCHLSLSCLYWSGERRAAAWLEHWAVLLPDSMRPQLKISSCPTSLTSDILTDFGFRLSAFLFFCVSQLSLLRRLRVYTQLIFDCFPTAIFLSSLLSSLCGTSFILWSWSIVTPTPALCTSLFISRWAQAQFLIVSQLAISSLSSNLAFAGWRCWKFPPIEDVFTISRSSQHLSSFKLSRLRIFSFLVLLRMNLSRTDLSRSWFGRITDVSL